MINRKLLNDDKCNTRVPRHVLEEPSRAARPSTEAPSAAITNRSDVSDYANVVSPTPETRKAVTADA